MTEKQLDEYIEAAMQQVDVPESVQHRIEKTTEAIRVSAVAGWQETADAAENVGRCIPKPEGDKPIHSTLQGRRKRHRWRRAWVAAAVLACSGITAFAATKLYRFQIEQKADHQIEVGVVSEESACEEQEGFAQGTGISTESDQIVLTEVPGVKMEVSYLPDGLIDNSADKGYSEGGSYQQADGNGGFFINQPLVMDVTKAAWTENFVVDHEMVSINGRECLYVATQNGTDENWLWKDLCIPFPEESRIVLIQAWGYASKEELLRIGEGISLVPTGEVESTEGMSTWSNYVAYKNQDLTEHVEDTDPSGDQVQLVATEEEMVNLYQIGDAFSKETRTHDGESVPLTVKVTGVRITEDLSPLAASRGVPEEWENLLTEEGKLGTAKRLYIRNGDGKNTVSEVVEQEDVGLRLVYVTIEYTNESGKDLQEVYYYGDLQRIEKEGDTYRMLTADTHGADSVSYDPSYYVGYEEMVYYDAADEITGKNYIPEIKPGETQTVHLAWILPEDEADHLYLAPDYYGTVGFSEEMLEEGLVQLN